MTIEIIRPSSREDWLNTRKRSVGASEVGALLGVHPWISGFELFAKKTGKIVDDSDSPALRRGRMLEQVAVQMIAEERPDWKLQPNPMPGGEFYRDGEIGLSCTPDLFVEESGLPGRANCQIKSVQSSVFRRDWKDEGGQLMPPLYAVVQSLVEARLTGAERAYVAALVVDYGIDVHIIEIPMHVAVVERAIQATREFWAMIDRGEEPPVDYARDGETIERMFSADDGSEADLSRAPRADQIVLERSALALSIKEFEEEKKALDAEMKLILGNHAVGRLADGRKVSWKTQTRREYIVRESTFRVLRYPS
jgi:predicted phage-related endonuclease